MTLTRADPATLTLAVNAETLTVRSVISTIDPDRSGDVVIPTGIQNAEDPGAEAPYVPHRCASVPPPPCIRAMGSSIRAASPPSRPKARWKSPVESRSTPTSTGASAAQA